MKQVESFKPLWRIHNKTYRRYARGCFWRRLKRYYGKVRALAGLLLRPVLRRIRKGA